MSNSQFKKIKYHVFDKPEANGHLWQIQSDKHVGVISIRFDENSSPNQIATKPVDHPMRHYFKQQMSKVDATVLETASAKMIHDKLASPEHAQNHYSFSINPRVKTDEFSAAAQSIIAQELVPHMVCEANKIEQKCIFVYPAEDQENHTQWMYDAFLESAQESGAYVVPAWIQIAEKKKVQGFQLGIL